MYHSSGSAGDRIDVYSRDARAQDRPPDAESELPPRHRAPGDHPSCISDRAAGRSLDRRLRALARWDHPKWGRMSPLEIHFTVAEEIGLIVDLGMFRFGPTAVHCEEDLSAVAQERRVRRSSQSEGGRRRSDEAIHLSLRGAMDCLCGTCHRARSRGPQLARRLEPLFGQ